jgi:Sulfotransferase family
VPKTGSSTGSSVNLRLASRIYQQAVGAASSPSSEEEVDGNRTQSASTPQHLLSVCRNRFQHASAFRLGYGRRDRMRSVLWSVVRDPTDRFVSEYFHFVVSRGRRNASDDSVPRKYLPLEEPEGAPELPGPVPGLASAGCCGGRRYR